MPTTDTNPQNENKNNTFYVGLCLAGAVSAGAYTAGVMDYMLEALGDWERRKTAGDPGVPTHKVEIPVMGGASAGGMTGIMTAAAIHAAITPIRTTEDALAKAAQNKLFNTWVNLSGHEDVFAQMLALNDIKKNEVYSLLNSDFITKLANNVVHVDNVNAILPSYFSSALKVFVTLSNLDGMRYSVGFKASKPDPDRYVISNHSDFACFQLARGANGSTDPGWIPLDFGTEHGRGLAANAAMATGAFPIGLRARRVERPSAYMKANPWFDTINQNNQLNPFNNQVYNALFVDGGMINNEPFEKVREVLNDITDQRNPSEYQKYALAKSTVLMIDPFPSEGDVMPKDEKLPGIIGATLGAMTNHLRIKPKHIENALDSDNAGQFLISPSRKDSSTGERIDGKEALACGALGGFGGFLSREFRMHDYFMGRANCEIFLRNNFTIPESAGNEIINSGYESVSSKTDFISKTDGGLQIIPIVNPSAHKYSPSFKNGSIWPTLTHKQIDQYESAISKRTESIVLNASAMKGINRFLLLAGSRILLRRKITDFVMNTIKDDLKKGKQLV